MMSTCDRRTMLRAAGLGGVAVPLLAACGQAPAPPAARPSPSEVSSTVSRGKPDPTAAASAVAPLTALGGAVFARMLAGTANNLVFSPYSLVSALGMLRWGARGETARAMDATMRTRDGTRLAAHLGSLSALIATRVRRDEGAGGVEWSDANALWGQSGIAWETPFLDGLATAYGAAMHTVDFTADPQAARRAVNAWVAQHTAGLITDLIGEDVFTRDTRLALVNAIRLKAAWARRFDPAATRSAPFTRADGRQVTAPFMTQRAGVFRRGPGWVAAQLPYVGGDLAMTLVLPDAGRDAAARTLVTGPALTGVLRRTDSPAPEVVLPRFSVRTTAPLDAHLKALGMAAAWSEGADFTGMTRATRLAISAVLQQAVITVDENGTEAAAATAAVAGAVSAPVPGPTLRFDRPFYAVVHDVPTATPLFVTRVGDPTAGG